ncbi:MAG TPA: hypothetical protein VH079_08725 [Terriglobales bacterium]|nr:hypothetical protein [Terriglobales bacterium]
MKSSTISRWDRETLRVLQLAICISFFAFLYYFRHGDVLLYGDAVAHTNIARRVFDSRTPGLLQLGTVWLPLPHLLIIPFVIVDSMWQSGVGASIPSLLAYVLGVVGIFRLVRGALSSDSTTLVPARIAAWSAAAVYAANPNLLYMQTTAMTEALYLALFIWALVHFNEFVQDASGSSLVKCGFCVAGACLTRYDGWFLGAVLCVAACVVLIRSSDKKALRMAFAKFVLLAAAAPVLWIAYNAIVYGNPLEFSNGPYSAKGVELRTSVAGSPPHPGTRNLIEAANYFLKSGELNLANGNWGRLWVLALILGVGLAISHDRRLWPLLLLAVPLPFYMLSIAYGGVPIFIPSWWPFTRYNVRYGLEFLPAFAVFTAVAAYFITDYFQQVKQKAAVVTAFAVLVVASYAFIWRDPVCYQEAWINSRTRIAVEAEIAANLKKLPRDANILMYLGDHVGALQSAGIPLRRVINEGNHRTWKRPSDPDGLWERALENPGRYADYVVASQGDEVSLHAQKDQLTSIAVIHVSGQQPVTFYWTHPLPAAAPR